MGARRHATPHECASAYHSLKKMVDRFGMARVLEVSGLSERLIREMLRSSNKPIARSTVRHIERTEKELWAEPVLRPSAPPERVQPAHVDPPEVVERVIREGSGPPVVPVRPDPEPEPFIPPEAPKPTTPVIPFPAPKPAEPAPEPKPAAKADPVVILRSHRRDLLGAVELLESEVAGFTRAVEDGRFPGLLDAPTATAARTLTELARLLRANLDAIEI